MPDFDDVDDIEGPPDESDIQIAALQDQIDDLTRSVETLTGVVGMLTSRVEELERIVGAQPTGTVHGLR